MPHAAAKKLKRYDKAGATERPKKEEAKREHYITKYAPLIKRVAGRLAMRLPSHVDQDDLLSAGIMGLLDAIEKFDENKGVPFRSYAEFRIRGAMLDELRSMDWVPRSVRKNAKRLEEAYGRVENRKMGPATDEEVAVELDMDLESFHQLLDQTRGTAIISEDEVGEIFSHKQSSSFWQLYQDGENSDPLSLLDLVELREGMADAIRGLPKNERMVLTLYYYEELTMKEIGMVMGYTESRISQLHTKAVMRLRHRIKKYLDIEVSF